jgi:hypothetical protein
MQVIQTKRLAQSGAASRPPNAGDKPKKMKKSIRMAGGQMWEDPSLIEWDQNDFRPVPVYFSLFFSTVSI